MPYLKREINPVVKMINGYEWSNDKLGEIMNSSTNTARRRKIKPDTINLGELHRLRTHGHIPKEEIMEAISKVI